MWIADQWRDYELLDCGGGEKLERWGEQVLVRPDPQAIWASRLETGGRPVSPLPDRRRPLGEEGPAGELEDPLSGPDLPGQAHELQAHGAFS